MSSITEQVLIVMMAVFVAVGISFVAFCDRLKDWLSGIPRVPRAQRNVVNAWRLRMIAKGQATWRTAALLVPSKDALDAMMAEVAEEAQRPGARIVTKPDSLVQASPRPEAERPDILFENGKAIIRPHTHLPIPVSTMRLTFQDGTEWDISADVEFAGLSEEDFRKAYAAFRKTQAELRGIENPPPINSKFWSAR